MTNTISKYIKQFAILASILMIAVIAIPMVAAETDYETYLDATEICDEAYEYDVIYECDETQLLTTMNITLYDLDGAEIEIINGMPFIVAEIEDGYIHKIQLYLSDSKDMMIEGEKITIEIDGNYLLIPTEYGIERTCISEFDVKIVDEKLILVHEINPAITSITTLILVGVASGLILHGINTILDRLTTYTYDRVFVNHRVGRTPCRFFDVIVHFSTINLDLNIQPLHRRDLESATIYIRARDVDRGDVFRIVNMKIGDLPVILSNNKLRVTGDERTRTTSFSLPYAQLDDIRDALIASNGRVQFQIRSCPNQYNKFITILCVYFVIDY